MNGMKMSLLQMNRVDESVKIFDDTDISLSIDSRQDGSQEILNLGVNVSLITLRMSYRDIMSISSIWYSILKRIPASKSEDDSNDKTSQNISIADNPKLSRLQKRISDFDSSQKSKVVMSGEKVIA